MPCRDAYRLIIEAREDREQAKEAMAAAGIEIRA